MTIETKLKFFTQELRLRNDNTTYHDIILLDSTADKYHYYVDSKDFSPYSKLKEGDIVTAQIVIYKKAKDKYSYGLYVNGINL